MAWAWLWPAKVSFIELEQLQARLVRTLLVFVTVISGVLVLRNLNFPHFPHGPVYLLIFVVAAAWVLLHLQPGRSRWILRGTLGCILLIVYWAALYWGTAVPPGVHFMAAFGFVATVIDSPASGNVISLISLGIMVDLRWRFGLPDPHTQTLWFNVSSCGVLAQLFGLAFYHVFVGVQRQLSDQAKRLQKADHERRMLVGALFEGLKGPLHGLNEAVAEPLGLAGGRIKAQVLAIADELQAAADLRQDPLPTDAVHEAEARLGEVRRRFMVITLWMALAAVLAATGHNVLNGGPLPLPLSIAVGLIAALVWLRGREVNVDAINRTQVLVYLALFVNGVWNDGLDGVPLTLPYLPNIVLAAALLSGFGLALVAGAVGAGLMVAVLVWGQHNFREAVTLGNLLLGLLLMTAICGEVWNLHAALLLQLHDRAEALAQSLRQRRRLLGTLFHDINNPLMAIQAVLQLPKAGVPLQASDQARVQHMAARIQKLVDAARSFLLGDAQVPFGDLKPVDVAQLFAETQELFEARLRTKRQHLTFTSTPGLSVLALPEVLRESVLSNLVSNALKFSPADSGLALEARVSGDEVALVVRDGGGGIPAAVLKALASGQTVLSTVGSAGEQGQGLGLSLVQEHLARLGGHLELVAVPGGTEARAWLRKA